MAYCITWPCRRLVIYLQRREFRGPSLCLYANVFHVKHFLYNDTKLSVRRCITAGRELFAMSFKRAVAGIGDDAAEFVAHSEIGNIFLVPALAGFPHVDVAASNAAGRYGDFDFAGMNFRYGDFFNDYLARSCEDGCFHHTRFHHHALSFIVQYINWRNVLTFGQPYYIIKVSFKDNLVFQKI